MIKTLSTLILMGITAIMLSACGAQPAPAKSANDISSTKKEKAMWQQFQNSKAQKSLDKEFQ